jgi:hypothetical protein
MTSVKQVGLLSAGSQPWNRDVCAASGDRFAYSATLAIYIYEVNLLTAIKPYKHVHVYFGINESLHSLYHKCRSFPIVVGSDLFKMSVQLEKKINFWKYS